MCVCAYVKSSASLLSAYQTYFQDFSVFYPGMMINTVDFCCIQVGKNERERERNKKKKKLRGIKKKKVHTCGVALQQAKVLYV